MAFHLLDCGVMYHVINRNVLFNYNRLLKVQLEINHWIIAYIEFDDEDDEAVENKTICTVVNNLAIIFHWFSCRSTYSKFSRQQNLVVQSKPPESRTSKRVISCHFTNLNNSCLYKCSFNFLYFSQFVKISPRSSNYFTKQNHKTTELVFFYYLKTKSKGYL